MKRNKACISCIIIIALMLLIGIITGLIFLISNQEKQEENPDPPTVSSKEIKRFASSDDFKRYLEQGQQSGIGSLQAPTRNETDFIAEEAAPTADDGGTGEKRVSQTNVQVQGIDEPDIVKTDGTYIYSSQQEYYYYFEEPLLVDEVTTESSVAPTEDEEQLEIAPPQPAPETNIVLATPPEDLKKIKSIDKQGNLLLSNDMLLVFEYTAIHGYDVSDPQNPKSEWTYEIKGNHTLVDARLMDGTVYLVMQAGIDRTTPCPLEVLATNKETITMPCTDIYYPNVPVNTDITYSVLSLNPANGEVGQKISFIGTSSHSTVYMSENALYVTYSYFEEYLSFIVDFINEKGKGLLSDEVIGKINDLMGYDISNQAKLTEIEVVLDSYTNSLPVEEQSRVENELTERMEEYYQEHVRDLEKTGIVKIPLDSFAISHNGTVPGRPLNQFSLDEYNGNFRIATTSGGSMWNSDGSVNDVYVLNDKLEQIGAITDMGLDERIYSARFIGDKGYLVTFKITDPFYVLDLSDPTNPRRVGELKIPGYSSYLHPISDTTILGVGMEDAKVKLSLFDVSDPTKPTEASKHMLEEYWTDVTETHHAFLHDQKHEVFFIPAGNAGYIFSYDNNALQVKTKVEDIQARRALYIDDSLYIVGEDKIVILDEVDWTEVKTLEL